MLVEERKDGFHWRTNPFEFFDNYGNQLTRAIKDASDHAKGDKAQAVGRDSQVYRLMTGVVQRCYLEIENKKLREALAKKRSRR
jgi:hypothetical protein